MVGKRVHVKFAVIGETEDGGMLYGAFPPFLTDSIEWVEKEKDATIFTDIDELVFALANTIHIIFDNIMYGPLKGFYITTNHVFNNDEQRMFTKNMIRSKLKNELDQMSARQLLKIKSTACAEYTQHCSACPFRTSDGCSDECSFKTESTILYMDSILDKLLDYILV